MKILLLLLLQMLLFGLLSNCSSVKENQIWSESPTFIKETPPSDYVDQLDLLSRLFLSDSGQEEIKLKKESNDYLNKIVKRLSTSSENIFKNKFSIEIHIIKSKNNFIFSLPRGSLFISSNVLLKYLKSEELLVSTIACEMLRIKKNIYHKSEMIPVGYLSLQNLARINKLNQDEKIILNEWVYYILKRAGFDSTNYLNWIQIMAKNYSDFSLMVDNEISLLKEEFEFKTFLAKHGVLITEFKQSEANNTSSQFYKIIAEVNKQANK